MKSGSAFKGILMDMAHQCSIVVIGISQLQEILLLLLNWVVKGALYSSAYGF